MFCYRDMTFCRFYNQCVDGDKCHRQLTEQVENRAKKANMPISLFAEKPECFIQIKEK